MLSRLEARRLRALHQRRGRERTGLFLIEGVRAVEDLLASGSVPRLALVAPSLEDSPRGRALAERLRAATRTVAVTDAELRDLADTETPQGILVAAPLPRRRLADLATGQAGAGGAGTGSSSAGGAGGGGSGSTSTGAAGSAGARTILVLDAVQDPGNVGTMIRTADALGVPVVIALEGTVDPWNPKVVRAAAGALFRTTVVESDAAEAIAWLRDAGYTIVGAAMDGTAVDAFDVPARTALVVGNEGAGLGAAIGAALDARVAIPIRAAAESLNAAVAAGILLYIITRTPTDA